MADGKTRIVLVVSALLASPLAHAQTSEHLLVPVHPGWGQWKTITNRVTPELTLIESIPASQRVDSIKDLVTQQMYSGPPPQATPAGMLAALHQSAALGCEKSRMNGPTVKAENGYPVAYGQFYCTKRKGTDYGVVAIQKAIQGKDALYLVQREWRLQPFEFVDGAGATGILSSKSFQSPDALMAWFEAFQLSLDYLGKQVYLCDARNPASPCPTASP